MMFVFDVEKRQQNTMETEQECAVNKLIREIDSMRQREQITIQQMEAEQDRLAVLFSQKLACLRKEREDLVNSMESENEAVVNKMLQQQQAASTTAPTTSTSTS